MARERDTRVHHDEQVAPAFARATTSVETALILGLFSLSATAAQSGAERPPLTQILAIRALAPDAAAQAHRVRIRGTVTHLNEYHAAGLVLHDGEVGQFVIYTEDDRQARDEPTLRRGDMIEVEGRTARGGFAPNVIPDRIRKLGRSTLPKARTMPYTALATGRYDCEYVEITGVGQRAWVSEPMPHTLFLAIRIDGGTVRASFWDHSPQDLERFVDARVRVRGSVGALFGEAGQLQGVSVLAGPASEVLVEDPPPEAFALPRRRLSSLFTYSAEGEVYRRVRIRGVVTHRLQGVPFDVEDYTANTHFVDVRHTLFVRDGGATTRVETSQETPLRPGDVIDIVGFPHLTRTKPILTNALFRKLRSENAPAPVELASSAPMAPEQDAQLVELRAVVLGQITRPSEQVLVLQSGATPFEARLDSPKGTPMIGALTKGSLVSVTGIYSYRPGPPDSFGFLLRSRDDIKLLQSGSWWTLGHSAVASVIVALFACAMGLWVRIIVNRNHFAQERLHAVVTERNRLAHELHDTLEQSLAGITLQLEAVSASVRSSPEVALRSLRIAREMLLQSMAETRRSVMNLPTQALENRTLAEALSHLAWQMTRDTNVTATVRVDGRRRPQDRPREHDLLRIGVEAITNAIKHSGASRIEILLRFALESTELVVSDNGCGFDPRTPVAAAEHFGLRGIRERVERLGGTLELVSHPGEGTTVDVTVPHQRSVRGE
jgi:signal transduction histidine kinase